MIGNEKNMNKIQQNTNKIQAKYEQNTPRTDDICNDDAMHGPVTHAEENMS